MQFEEALEELRSTGGSCVPVIVFSNFAGWLLSFGMVQRARQVLQEAVVFASTSAMTWQSATTLTGLALADALESKMVIAARRLGAVEAIRIRADLTIPIHYQLRLDQATQLARDHLGQRAFQREWERGHSDPLALVATMREDTIAPLDRRGAEVARELGLTLREVEVLALVAAGMSDRDIAAKLFISVRTASKHVGSILVKMGVTSRAEAAVRAMHMGLA
jgi:DNA-binding NarL/FixJ family response regulator